MIIGDNEIVLSGEEEIGIVLLRGDDSINIVNGRHAFDVLLVEAEHRLLHVRQTSRAASHKRCLQLVAKPEVLRDEAMRERGLAIQQHLADEHISRALRIDFAEVDGLPSHFEAMHEHAFPTQHAARFHAPVRLAVFVLAEVIADFDDPLGLDLRDHAGEKLGGLHDLAGHDPERLRRLLRCLTFAGFLLLFFAALVKIGTGEERGEAVA